MATFVEGTGLLVPEGSRVLHIGPHKTGTTSLQSALAAARPQALEQGVRYVGRGRHPMRAVLAVLGRAAPRSDVGAPPEIERWEKILEEIHASEEPRTVLSSEFFADAKDESIRTVVDAIGADEIQVIVTLRPLAKLIPSQWQQYIQSGATAAFDDWLREAFDHPDKAARFWRRHRHDQLIARWAAVVGPDRVTAVVVDDTDHSSVLRSFEQIVGLTDGTLVADRDLSNRSLTLGEVESVREFNLAFWGSGQRAGLHAQLIRSGAAHHLQARAPEPHEPKILMPQWALDQASEVSRQIIDGIKAQDIKVTGDLEQLMRQPVSRESVGQDGPIVVDPVVAGRLAIGVMLASGVAQAPPQTKKATTVPPAASGKEPRAAARDAARKADKRAARKAARKLAALGPTRRFMTRALRSIARRADERATKILEG